MSLHNGIDTVGWVSLGLYSETYGDGEQSNINNLFASLGMIEAGITLVALGGGIWSITIGMGMDM